MYYPASTVYWWGTLHNNTQQQQQQQQQTYPIQNWVTCFPFMCFHICRKEDEEDDETTYDKGGPHPYNVGTTWRWCWWCHLFFGRFVCGGIISLWSSSFCLLPVVYEKSPFLRLSRVKNSNDHWWENPPPVSRHCHVNWLSWIWSLMDLALPTYHDRQTNGTWEETLRNFLDVRQTKDPKPWALLLVRIPKNHVRWRLPHTSTFAVVIQVSS